MFISSQCMHVLPSFSDLTAEYLLVCTELLPPLLCPEISEV